MGLLVISNCFWGFYTHKLLNKLMSRSFWEYQEAKVYPKAKAQNLKEALKDVKVADPNKPEMDRLDALINEVGLL